MIMKGFELHKTGARVNQLLERQFVVPTLDHAPNSSTTTWQDDDYVVTFRIGEQCRVKEDGEWRFYRLQDVENGRANWVRVDISEMPDLSGYYTKQETDEQIANKVSEIELPDMSDYYTKQQIDNKGYLTSIPSQYVTESELESKGYLTTIPTEYVTESELEQRLDGIEVNVDLDDYYTKQQIDGKGYVTSAELVTKDYASKEYVREEVSKVDLSDYYTKGQSDSKYQPKGNYLTSIPAEYVTESELESKGYLTSVPSQYVTESELSGKNYATEQWVEEQGYLNTSEVDKKIQDAINESIDLDDYYTKQETDKQIEDKVSAITFPDDESILNVTEDEYEELKATESLSDKTLYFVSKDGSPIALYIGKVQIAVREEGSKGFAYNFPIIF